MQLDFWKEEKPSFELREYQNEILAILDLKLKPIFPRPIGLIQLPTGMGKTVVFATYIARSKKRTLVIAHRQELLYQAKEKIARAGICPEKIDVVLQSEPDPNAMVWVASVQTIIRVNRIDRIKPELIVVDECHHAIAKSYQRILEVFYNVPTVGFTATPYRMYQKEQKKMAELWKEIWYQYPIKKAILDGYLAFIEYYEVKTSIDLDDIKNVAGDFDQDALSKQVNVESRNSACVEKYLELGGGKAIVFCVNVKHASNICQMFLKFGINAYILTGETKEKSRQKILQTFQNASMSQNVVLCNCMVLTEGYDCSDIRMVIMARPTKSPVVYLQQLGRGMRKAPGKNSVIVVDIADNCKDQSLCNCLTTVFELHPQIEVEGNVLWELNRREAALEEVAALGEKEKETTDQQQEDVELHPITKILFQLPMELEKSILAWYSPKLNEYVCSVDKGKYLVIEDKGLSYELYGINPKLKKLLLKCNGIEEIEKKALEIAMKYYSQTRYMWDKSKRKDWSNMPPTQKQIEVLKKLGIDPSKISKATASEIIAVHLSKKEIESATEKQLLFLQKRGITYSQGITKKEANRLIVQYKIENEEVFLQPN